MPITQDQIEWHIARQKKLSTSRGNWENMWQDVVDYLMPWKSSVTAEQTPGQKKTQLIYDSTPSYALDVLAAGLMGHLTSQAAPWFQLTTRNPGLMKIQDVQEWLQECTRRMVSAFNMGNFHTSIQEFYEDLAGFGTGAMFSAEDPVSMVRFYVFPIREVHILENKQGLIDTVYREYRQSVRELAQEFGPQRLNSDLMDMLRDRPDEVVTCLHCVFPREDFNPNLDLPTEFPVASVYLVPEHKHVLQESGYHENPWHIARWYKGSRETYGRGPGINAMPDIKTLHQQRRSDLRGGQKIVEPPLWVPASFKGRLRTTPNAVNYFRKGDEKPDAMNVVGQLPFGLEMTQDTRALVNKAFFVDVFLMLAQQTGEKTAYEVAERVQERLMILGPVVGRLHSEGTGPLIERSFNVMARRGYFPPPPEALLGQQLDIEYISPLAKAMKAMEGRATQDAILFANNFFTIDPASVDNVDTDEAVRRGFEIYGAPMDLLRSPDTVQKIREQRAKATQAQAMMQTMQQGADIAKTASEAGQEMGGAA